MKEPIFKSEEKMVTARGTMLSFDGCPNKCIDGFYIDPYKHKKRKCLYCEDKRKQLVKEEIALTDEATIREQLNIGASFVGYGTNSIDSVIPEFAAKVMEPASVSEVLTKMRELVEKVSVGEMPSYSIMFNLGKKAFEMNFIYPYMMRAYMSGLTVCPLIDELDLSVLRNEYEAGISATYTDYLKRDICVVVISAGATNKAVGVVKGLMQQRAYKDKPTLIVTNFYGSAIYDMCTEDDVHCNNLATPYSITYLKKFLDNEQKREETLGNKRQVSQVGLSTKDFNSLMGVAPNTLR